MGGIIGLVHTTLLIKIKGRRDKIMIDFIEWLNIDPSAPINWLPSFSIQSGCRVNIGLLTRKKFIKKMEVTFLCI